MKQPRNSILQGMMGNLSEISGEALEKKFGSYLMEGETIQTGFQLIVDVIVFTDRRLITFDKQDAVSPKMRVDSIYLDSITQVSLETAGIGIDDSRITITYITSPYFRASHGVICEARTYEFPKRYDIRPLYSLLQKIAYDNHIAINS
ncbi:MAG: PH domain-containing protein [Candidatus Onthomonas sp.]|nr:PH domain-containing protein [Candidatus Onthomonas sp.]